MSPSVERLRSSLDAGPLVLDGATGTELERRQVDCALPLWSAGALIETPDVVRTIHADYVAAGADILVANTFRTNVRTLRVAGRLADGVGLSAVAVDLARQAAGEREVWVAASVAPVADCYHPERVPPVEELRAEHGQMMAWLARAGPDLVWVETMGTIAEARVAADAAARHDLPLAVSFVVQENGALLGGESLRDAIEAIEAFEPLAIGLNCIPPSGVSALLPRLRDATDRPLAAYAHVDNVEPIRGWSFAEQVEPAAYATHVNQWLEAGVGIVGGCCGTTPAHIAEVRSLVDARLA